MYLKAIEIYGFKSFANKAKMPLNPGITCIVGPNGCGKSNVVDSIKWCIGEMSWKSLRMPSMMDVIFSGTTRRRPLNMAEVSMTFDNAERKLPLDFSEVTVTRKIYRSDESEYFINKVQCRLKDIREMFLDTGIGTDGYAIIDQGQVDRLLNATPEQRREMFEEAAGVSKYKSKREEAFSRLEKVQADLNRLSDSMVLLQEQIKKLEAEARKARLQQKYRDELQAAEIALLLKEYEDFSRSAADASSKLEPLLKAQEDLQAGIVASEGEISALNIAVSQKKDSQNKLREAINALIIEKNRLESLISHNRQSLQDISGARKSLEISEKNNAEKIARSEPVIKELRIKIDESKKSFPGLKQKADTAKLELDNYQAEIKKAEALYSQISAKINAAFSREIQLSQFLARSMSDISHYKENIKSLERDSGILESNGKRLAEELSSKENAISLLKSSLEEEKKKNSLSESGIKDISAEISRSEQRISDIRAEMAAQNARLEAIIAQAKKNSYWVGQKTVLKAAVPGVLGSLRSFLKIKKSDRIAAEDVFGKFLDSLLCENKESAENALEMLKKSGKGRCRFIILDKVPVPGGIIEAGSFAGRITYPEHLKPLLKYLSSGAVADDSGTARTDFWIAGGAAAAVSSEPYWGEEAELKESLSLLEEERKTLESKKENLRKELENLRKEASSSREKTIKLNLDINTAENRAKSARESLAANKERIKLLALNKENAAKELKKSEESAASFEKALAGARLVSESGRKEQSEIDAKKQALNSEFAAKKENYAICRSRLDNFSRSMDALAAELARSEADSRYMSEEREHFSSRRKELDIKEQSLAENSASAEKSLEKTRSELSEKEISLNQLEKEINASLLEYSRYEENLKSRRSSFSENEKTRIKLETEIVSYKSRAEETELRLSESWNIGISAAAEKYGGISADRDRVNFLRRRAAAMGPVNMTAPEEHEALSQRYSFIMSQAEDLKKAETDLRSAIAKINDTTKSNFRITFDKVSEYFKEIYSLLFNGGEAELQLTMPDNLLETGVEIMAHPPGKRLVSITQLSGGEKALTALALLFSFFRVSPSPFCIMDETDAPLDEANVERFVKLIKEFSSSTQFLVITHNKRTMEAAETLYGVTMEELGVSKLVSVDLKKAADMTEQAQPKSQIKAGII